MVYSIPDAHAGHTHEFCVSGRTVEIGTVEQLINFGASRTVYGFKSPPTQSPKTLTFVVKNDHYGQDRSQRQIFEEGDFEK